VNNISLSYWSRGNLSRGFSSDLDKFLIHSCIGVLRKYTPDSEITLYTDGAGYEILTDSTRANCEIRVVLDQYNTFEPKQWGFVKILTMIDQVSTIETFHLDFDIIWKQDLSKLDLTATDTLYQKYDRLYPEYQHFCQTHREMVKGKNLKYVCGGVTYYKDEAIKEIIRRELWSFLQKDLWTKGIFNSLSFEQVWIPTILHERGYHIDTLADHQLEKAAGTTKPDIFEDKLWNKYIDESSFIPESGFYHFMGGIKTRSDIKELINSVIGI
jgi:hypothetical protein